jgi:DNA replication and repair protein RecF
VPLTRLRVEAFRCLEFVELELHRELTCLFGPNGAGKTSLLEAIYFLGRGRSFRTPETRRLLQWGRQGFAIYGECSSTGDGLSRMGVAFSNGAVKRRLNGVEAIGIATLAERLPVYVIDPGAHELIGGGPRMRRQFLDWGVFHVEHAYLDTWRRYRRALGQRNAGLRKGQSPELLAPWTELVAAEGRTIDAARRHYLEQLRVGLERLGRVLLGESLEADYQRGWRQGLELEEALEEAAPREQAAGVTLVGPHRADMSVRLAGHGVRDTASRGQQKLVATALVLSQVEVAAREGKPATLLVDDPGAELDRERVVRILDALCSAPAQVVITALSREELSLSGDFPMFHVEQGEVTPVL